MSTTQASVSTHLEDYAPGSTAIVTATGFSTGSTITFEVDHVLDAGTDGVYGTSDDTLAELGGSGHLPWSVTDGGAGDLDGLANGTIVTSWYVNPDDSAGATFHLSARGSGADGIAGTQDDQLAYDSFTDSEGNVAKIYLHWSDVDNAWQNDILNVQKGSYAEGEVVPHVFFYKAAPNAQLVNGQSYTFSINYDYTKGGAGGFAYLTTYNISRAPDNFDGSTPGVTPLVDSSFTEGTGDPMRGSFYTVDGDVTNVSAASTTSGGGGTQQTVTVTFTYTGTTTSSGFASFYFGLKLAEPGEVAAQGASGFSGGNLQTDVDGSSIQLMPEALVRGTISGYKFGDLDGDGQWDSNESGLAGWTIFLDQDGDGVLDAGEASTTTDASGRYSFSVTPDADKTDGQYDNDPYLLREVNQTGWVQTTANPAPIYITKADPNEADVNFGNQEYLPSLNIAKSVSSITDGPDALNGAVVNGAGDVINYSITVQNTGNTTLTGLSVTDPFADVGSITRTTDAVGDGDNVFEVGETWAYTAAHTVTQAEIDAGGNFDSADADSAFDQLRNVATADTNETPEDTDDAVVDVVQNPAIDVEKYVWNGSAWLDADSATGPALLSGSAVQFKFVVSNTGNVTLNNVTLSDLNLVTNTLEDINGATAGTNITIATLAPGASATYTYNDTWAMGQQSDRATATAGPVSDSDDAHYVGYKAGVGGLTPGFWGQHFEAWDYAVATDRKGNKDTANLVNSGVLTKYDVLPTAGWLLLGDTDGDGTTDAGESTLKVSLEVARLVIRSQDSANDTRQILMKHAIAAQLNILNGDKQPADLITEAVDWLKGKAPYIYADGSTGNVDADGDGDVEAGSDYRTSGSSPGFLKDGNGSLTGTALTSNLQAWKAYVDVDGNAGGMTANGEGLKNALMHFNQNQLVTLNDGALVAFTNGSGSVLVGPVTNQVDAFWGVLDTAGVQGIGG